MPNKTITLPSQTWDEIQEAVRAYCDLGPAEQGWKSHAADETMNRLDTELAKAEISGYADFHPTVQLRFETLHYGEHMQHRTVQLQQLWRSDTAEEWRAVPTEL